MSEFLSEFFFLFSFAYIYMHYSFFAFFVSLEAVACIDIQRSWACLFFFKYQQ